MSFSPSNKKPHPIAQHEQTAPDAHFEYDDRSLAARLRIALATLRAWRCRSPHLLPPGVKIGRNWFYDKLIVEEWLAAKRISQVHQTQPTSPGPGPLKRRGKPSKTETAEAKAAGLTVPALRALKMGGQK